MAARGLTGSTVFIGSSTAALEIAKTVERGLSGVANVIRWDAAFNPGGWLLGGILNRAQQSDFAVFVIREDDTARIKKTKYFTVRDNVLFEVGIFMGAIGPERTILLWPTSRGGIQLRLPSDLEGLLRVSYAPSQKSRAVTDLRKPLAVVRRHIVNMGPALRSGYNEIRKLKQELEARDIEFEDDSVESLHSIVARAARRRRRPWYVETNVELLTGAIEKEGYDDPTVDYIFWWLIVYGVITFDNVEEWSSDGSWHWSDTIEYTNFTERGVVLLNELRSAHT